MAKVTAKSSETSNKKSPEGPTKKKPSAKTAVSILKVTEGIHDKLKALHLDPALQSDIVWCIGSYRHDKNPVGLYENAAKALVVFKGELAKKTKGITAKFIGDIEKALAAK